MPRALRQRKEHNAPSVKQTNSPYATDRALRFTNTTRGDARPVDAPIAGFGHVSDDQATDHQVTVNRAQQLDICPATVESTNPQKPWESTGCEEGSHRFYIGHTKALKSFWTARFKELTLGPLRCILITWVKRLVPQSEHGFSQDDQMTRLFWWPRTVPYVEPSNMSLQSLIRLGIDIMLVHRRVDRYKSRCESWIELLQEDAEHAINSLDISEFSKSENPDFNLAMKNRAVEEIFPSLFEVAKIYENHVHENNLHGGSGYSESGRGKYIIWFHIRRPPNRMGTWVPRPLPIRLAYSARFLIAETISRNDARADNELIDSPASDGDAQTPQVSSYILRGDAQQCALITFKKHDLDHPKRAHIIGTYDGRLQVLDPVAPNPHFAYEESATAMMERWDQSPFHRPLHDSTELQRSQDNNWGSSFSSGSNDASWAAQVYDDYGLGTLPYPSDPHDFSRDPIHMFGPVDSLSSFLPTAASGLLHGGQGEAEGFMNNGLPYSSADIHRLLRDHTVIKGLPSGYSEINGPPAGTQTHGLPSSWTETTTHSLQAGYTDTETHALQSSDTKL
ncbi:hypothetical protein N0V90_013363 [Kalmusia sp. IMI 367209]|nr:hypothetical protein N0V90_013363 [Kalmusia sp. IMI 367209]